MVKKLVKEIALEIFKVVTFFIKLAILSILLLWFGYDSIIVLPTPYAYAFVIYECVMVVCLLSLGATYFKKYRLKAYLTFIISLLLYVVMFFSFVPIVDQHEADRCLDSGQGVWDYDRRECRKDCWKWDKEHGCYKEAPKE